MIKESQDWQNGTEERWSSVVPAVVAVAVCCCSVEAVGPTLDQL